MTVQDLLRATPRDALIDFFIPYRFDEVKPEDMEEARAGVNDWMEGLLKRTAVENDNVLFAHISYVEESRFAVSVLHRDDVEKWVADGMRVIDPAPDDPASAYPLLPQIYALGFTAWDHVLGLQVDEESVNAHGINLFLSEVLQEMSFFGFDESDMVKERDEVIAQADRLDAMTPEERANYGRPADEVFREMAEKYGFEYHERSPEEIEAQNRRIEEEVRLEYAERYRVMKAYVSHAIIGGEKENAE